MGITKTKLKPKKTTKKILSKKQKKAKRVSKVQKLLQYRKRLKKARKGKVVPIKKKRQQEADEQIIDFSSKKQEQGATDAQVNILNLLGFANGDNVQAMDWEQKLQQKLQQANSKSLQNPQVRRVYGEIGRIFSTYRSGKVPRAFKVIPNLQKWKQVILITRPDNWTPQAMYQAVNIFASNFDAERAQQFYQQFLVPAIKNDLKKNKKLNYHYYQSLKKGLYKTNAWFRGIMFKFCSKDTLLRQISVIESLLTKMTIPVISSSVALIKLCEMQPNTAILHYIGAIIGKSYNFPKRIISVMINYLKQFQNIKQQLPIVWHNMFLTFCRQYGSVFDQMTKSDLISVVKSHHHKFISPEILKELN